MSRYRGRHRKPTHTGRNLAAVSTSGAFLAAGLTTSPGEAHAASAWDVIADCESGGRNIENSGGSSASGFFQIIDGTWRANGGLEFASRAIGATFQQQLTVAQRIAANRGSLADWNASKSCWGDQIPSSVPAAAAAPAPAPAPRRAAPAPQPRVTGSDVANLGQRAADGSGQYRCTEADLSFDACDPDTLGQVVTYPLYTHAAPAQPAPAPVSAGRHALKPATTPGKPSVSGQTTAPAGGDSVTDAAKQLLGTPYVWGGTTSSGVDCSGLVYNALQQAGHTPPRTAAAMQDWATPVSKGEARAGDLFFWSPGGGTATHTGIYLGDNKVIEVSQPGTTVTIRGVYSGMTFGRIP